ncbi:MAG: hypothetical protein QOF48_3750 [Verrucomicrobiota bacterium]|jgi:PAS domain S-box-containing protein
MDPNAEIPALIETLLASEQRLEELTGGEVDTVAGHDGRTFLLRRAQEQLRFSEAASQAAILDALPAHIALVDPQGIIISVNESWRRFAHANVWHGAGHGIGLNYLDVCERANGDFSSEAVQVAAGIRAVLDGREKCFSIEYPCHSPTELRWFLLKVTPLADDRRNGAVVMHINITERKIAEDTLRDSEASLSAAQRIGHFGSWELELFGAKNDNGPLLRWSDEMFRIAGFEPGAVETSNEFFFRIVHPDDRESIREAVAIALRERQPYSIVHRLIRPNGEERVIQEMGQVFFEEETGQPLKIVGTAHDITAQRKAEEALRDSEERFVGAFEHAPIGVALVSIDGRWLKTNQAIRDLFGYSEEELQTRTIVDLTHPEDIERSWQNVGRALAGDIGSFQIEKRYIHKRGNVISALLNISLIRDAEGQPLHFVTQIQDITERKQAEETRSRLAAIVESSSDAIIGKTLEGLITSWNAGAERLFGYPAKEIIGQPITMIIPPDHREEETKFLARLRLEERIEHFETIRLTKDGRRIQVSLSISQVHDAAGRLIGTSKIARDITASKQAEAALQRQQAELRVLFDLMPAMLWFKDTENRILRVNKRVAEAAGKSIEEIEGKPSLEIYPQDAARFYADDLEVIRAEAPKLGYVETLRGPDGRDIWVQTDKVPYCDKDGKVSGIVVMAQDITERKRSEAALEKAHKELVQTSRRAGMAEVATEVLHNVGNVLNSVNVSATLLGERLRKSKTAGFVKIIGLLKEQAADLPGFFARDARAAPLPSYLEQFAQHLTSEQQLMIGEVENLRKNIEHIKEIVAMQQSCAKVSGITETINPADLIEDTLLMNAGELERHAIEVVKEFDEVPPIEVDKHKVLQILVNFVTNARDACDDSGRIDKRITLRLRRCEDRVLFSVIDNGVGIPAEHLNRIFHHGFTTKKDGHGFGLHSGSLAAKELGGAMSVHSDGPGCGASFTLELPLTPNTGGKADRKVAMNAAHSDQRAL